MISGYGSERHARDRCTPAGTPALPPSAAHCRDRAHRQSQRLRGRAQPTQPALSKALKEVEAMLGFRLFNRGARGLQKTAQGEIVMHGAILMLREVEHLHAEARSAGPDGRVAGILRLGAPAFLSVSLLPRVMARLAAASP